MDKSRDTATSPLHFIYVLEHDYVRCIISDNHITIQDIREMSLWLNRRLARLFLAKRNQRPSLRPPTATEENRC